MTEETHEAALTTQEQQFIAVLLQNAQVCSQLVAPELKETAASIQRKVSVATS